MKISFTNLIVSLVIGLTGVSAYGAIKSYCTAASGGILATTGGDGLPQIPSQLPYVFYESLGCRLSCVLL